MSQLDPLYTPLEQELLDLIVRGDDVNSVPVDANQGHMRRSIMTMRGQRADIDRLKSLLNEAKCPCCDGGGAYYDGHGSVAQCQWCYERKNESN